jgi:hypothetical protein
MELGSFHSSGTYSFDIVSRFCKNMWTSQLFISLSIILNCAG